MVCTLIVALRILSKDVSAALDAADDTHIVKLTTRVERLEASYEEVDPAVSWCKTALAAGELIASVKGRNSEKESVLLINFTSHAPCAAGGAMETTGRGSRAVQLTPPLKRSEWCGATTWVLCAALRRGLCSARAVAVAGGEGGDRRCVALGLSAR